MPSRAERGSLDRRVLAEAGSFALVLRGGERWEDCTLEEIDAYCLIVHVGGQRRLLLKHAVDYFVLLD
jgi:sRNA-binding regulator protein Hfq